MSAPRCRVFPDWDVIQLVSSSQEGASVQATSTLHQTGGTTGEDGEVFLLFWKFETNVLYFIAFCRRLQSDHSRCQKAQEVDGPSAGPNQIYGFEVETSKM